MNVQHGKYIKGVGKMKVLKRFTAAALAITLAFTVLCTNASAAGTQSGSDSGEYLKDVMDLIQQKYNGNATEDELINSSIKGMFNSLDDYSTLYNQDEFNAVYGSLEGAVEGVGIQVQFMDDYVTVLKVFAGSPAQKAGVLSGDKIAVVNGEDVKGKKMEDVIGKVKGPSGTKVKLGLLRQGVKDIITLEMKRSQVVVPSVNYEIRGDVGYIVLDSFTSNAYSGITEALDIFSSHNITKVVLDLRNNPGGFVEQAVLIANEFVPKGLITTLDYKDPDEKDIRYFSTLEKMKYKLAVLVNENSASSSEILAGAIKDSKAGILVGTKTFGKAKVQEFYPILSQEAYERLNKNREDKTVNAYEFKNALQSDLIGWGKMTIGMYYTPNGNCIDLKGIEPNITVKANNEDSDSIPVNLLELLDMTVKPSLGTQYMDVYRAENILKLLNYDVDKPDYTLDSKTFAAIKKFQKDNKIYSYGVLDFSTQSLLNEKLSALKQSEDAVYAKAVEELNK